MNGKKIVTPFAKASYSGSANSNECVEVAHTADGGRAVRDSKNPAHGTQYHSPAAWAAFLGTLKGGGA